LRVKGNRQQDMMVMDELHSDKLDPDSSSVLCEKALRT
jgi:hypothetical protein